MSRFTEPMILAREAGQPEPPQTSEGDFWARMEARGVKILRAKATVLKTVEPGNE